VYTLVNTLLITVNLLFVPAFYWFVFPLIGWGIGVTMHYTFGVRRFEAQLKAEEAKIEHIAKK
jgi:two-component system LytT family sensor kinase